MSLDKTVKLLTDTLVTSILTALTQSPIGALVDLDRQKVVIRCHKGRYYASLPDGREWKGTRRRDLVRRAKQQGFEVT